jgi:hypothetical protein
MFRYGCHIKLTRMLGARTVRLKLILGTTKPISLRSTLLEFGLDGSTKYEIAVVSTLHQTKGVRGWWKLDVRVLKVSHVHRVSIPSYGWVLSRERRRWRTHDFGNDPRR